MKKLLIILFSVLQIAIFSQSTNLNGWNKTGNMLIGGEFFGSINSISIPFKINNNTLFSLNTNSTVVFTSTINLNQLNLTGASGTGFVYFPRQLANPSSTLSTGFRIFGDVAGSFSWLVNNGSDNYIRKFSGALTANRSYLLPDNSGTVALLSDIPLNSWSLIGNSTTASNFIGTTNNISLRIKTNNIERVNFDTSGMFRLHPYINNPTSDGSIYFDPVTNGLAVFTSSNSPTWCLSATNNTVFGFMYPTNVTNYQGFWVGTSSAHPLHLVTNGNGGGTPALTVSSQSTGAVGSVIINPAVNNYTTDASLHINQGGGTYIIKAMINSTNTAFNIARNTGVSTFSNDVNFVKHIIGKSSTPTATLGTGAGSGATFTLTGNDIAGTIDITTAGTPAGSNAVLITITYNSVYSVTPVVLLDRQSATSVALGGTTQVYVDSPSNTTNVFIIKSGTIGLTTGTVYRFAYHVIGK